MKFSRFLVSKCIALTVIVAGLCGWCVFASLTGVSGIVIGITFASVAVCTVCWLAGEYVFICKRLKKLNRICAEVKEGYLLGELIPEPVNAVEEEYFKVMKTVSRSAVAITEEEKRAKEEYVDYVEKWIHEIKTPLTACSLVIANGGDTCKLKTELKRAENLTENILYCARLRTIEADTQISKISVGKVVDRAVKSQTELLLQAGISIEADADFTVHTDGNALEFILKQLLVNCAKYCQGCRIKITAENKNLIFEDNGCGVPPHEISRLFARGFVGVAGRKRGGGTGMGLYLVGELCRKLAIDWDVSSEEGNYLRFVFKFKG